jgi:orotate phosphoribosyltransferase
MKQEDVFQLLDLENVIHQNDHFVYTSGLHGSTYFNKDAIYSRPLLLSKLCLEFAYKFRPDKVETVVAPASGGTALSQWTAYHLSLLSGKEIFATYAEKSKTQKGEFQITRDYQKHITSKRVLVLEDVITTGNSAKAVIEKVKDLEGEVVGLGVLCNRSDLTVYDFNVPKFVSLLKLNFKSWSADQCPLCKQEIPINKSLGNPY